MTDISERLRDGEKRFLKWAHKEQYSGPSVLSIPRHPDNIDALLDEAAAHIDAQDAKIKALVEALQSIERNTDAAGHGFPIASIVQQTCRQIARAALAAAKETT
ncbi:hypothetical protein [Sulfitobacter sp. PM12]|uniref:hypothetical protein n=1 Tax=Sulfitobacter sp. PM12 TaxID=3138497 RepID=UPI00388DE289